MKNSAFKKIIRSIHLWLGLSSGIIVFIIAVTGCFYAFQEEILNITEEYRFVEKQNAPLLLPSSLEKIARKEFPNKVLHAIKYNGSNKSAEAIFFSHDDVVESNDYYNIIYLNPYSGEVLEVADMYSGFFRWILDGHFYLWLPHEIGQTVCASATLIFMFMLITGLILWYPKNRKAAKQRFWFRWREGLKWKRKNYDLHNITGFYVMSIALIFAVTGLVWGFPWFAYGYYTLMGGDKSLVYEDPASKKEISFASVEKPLDKVFILMKKEYPKAQSIEVHPPESDSGSIAANANLDEGTYWKTDYRYFDQYTLKEKKVNHIYGKLQDATTSDKLMRMNYDIHTGAILGLPGKIFAFLISLLIASLPVTGFLIWYGRRNKKTPK
ncbi:PepSY domain-containing protein [Flavobacterium sp. J49]|uniref:PepSY-associated TM helix domain-containing protein n=1 Tax=Flavobacterium sp. J49 TaxID=2718534 RepID=UPI0015934EC2|nr:PepSY-associated TM helix domain-containing protein [Flavobacterium sp. J49]MBF6640693.1 PepSY domain-containing protein [Flavobacterium sp. J49]NIC01940.1 PepSY domain-containing protein [Flavobacterium sp. J49]